MTQRYKSLRYIYIYSPYKNRPLAKGMKLPVGGNFQTADKRREQRTLTRKWNVY